MLPDYLFYGPAPDFPNPRDRALRRALEILPGALTWVTLTGIFFGSFFAPALAALFIIAFALYWITNAVYFSIFIIRSWLRMRKSLKTDWMLRLKKIVEISPVLRPFVRGWEDVTHLVVFPMVNEGVEIVAPALEAVEASDYPNEKLWIILATEERAGEGAQNVAQELERRFSSRFGKFLVTTHPANLEGEIPGKGSNQTYAVRRAVAEWVEKDRLPYERFLVSSFDSDTRVFPQYFSCLTYHYLVAKKPTRSSYQPIPLFHNNIWEAPPFSRIPAIGSTVWQLFMQSQPELQETFSSHSMSLKGLVDVGYWNRRLVNEDSIIFWQCYVAFDGDYRTIPLYYPVSMDANVASSAWKTAVSIYRQHRRWAYGVEKLIFALYGFAKNARIPRRKKVSWTLRLVFGFWMWACASPLLLTLGWLPVALGGDEFRQGVLSFNLPLWTRNLMMLASFGLLINSALTFLLLPARPPGVSRRIYASLLLQWPFMPLSLILFGAVPAIDAQTRMMFGKYLGFWVTQKVRKRRAPDAPQARP